MIMKNAAEFRSIARDALSGKWRTAVLVTLVAGLLGAVGSFGPEFKINLDVTGLNFSLTFADQTIYSTSGGVNQSLPNISEV